MIAQRCIHWSGADAATCRSLGIECIGNCSMPATGGKFRLLQTQPPPVPAIVLGPTGNSTTTIQHAVFTCTCVSGFSGHSCNIRDPSAQPTAVPTAPPGARCYTHLECGGDIHGGSCVNSRCVCATGFMPPACAPFCTQRTDCNGHGDCEELRCACDATFSGPRCAVFGCALQCGHGGLPDRQDNRCTRCTGCALGWGGRTCQQWNAAILPQLGAHVRSLHKKSIASLAAIPNSPLPGSVGWGANAWSGSLAKVPVVKLTYTDPTKVWGEFRVPVQAVLEPYRAIP